MGAHTFTGVCVFSTKHVYVPAVADELAEKNEDHALIFRYMDGKWAHRPLAFAVGSVCHIDQPKPLVLAMGINGEVNIFTSPGGPGAATETMDTSDEGPSELVHLKCIRAIGDHVYAVGMARRAYRRLGENRWVAIDQGVFVPRNRREQAVGFNAIDGRVESALYAVGYKGEIWYFDGNTWHQQESPTNVVLSCVRCLSDDVTYAAGMAGTLLRGRNGQWKSVDHGATEKDFWGMTIFKDHLYVANYDGVFRLDGETLDRVDMKLPSKLTTAYLDANAEVMWSVGHKDLACTRDEATWVEIEKPD